MTPDEIKRTWAEAAKRVYAPTPAEYESMFRDRKVTALENLIQRYKRFSNLGLLMILMSFCWMFANLPFESRALQITVSIVLMVYFASCSIIDYYLYREVRSIDCYTMSVSQVIEKAMNCRKKHLESMIFLIPFAILVAGLMAYSFKAEKAVIIGMAAGGITGLVLGYRQFRKFMDDYKRIKGK